MDSYKKLINNTFIFSIGNLGTKLITFFLVPLYTYNLSTIEYGLTDLINTTISLLIPVFTLSTSDAILRFVMDKTYDKRVVLNNTLLIFFIGFVTVTFILLLFQQLLPFERYIMLFIAMLFTQTLQIGLGQYVRAQGKVYLFALNGIFSALVIFIGGFITLVKYNFGIIGYFISYIFGYSISIFLLIIKGQIWKDINIKLIKLSEIKKILRYSFPLMPNSLMWWIVNSSNRYVITLFLGLSANGIFGVSSKIPSLLNVVNSIFFQAWQMSAIEEYDSKENSKFYSTVFNIFSFIMLFTTSLILFLLKFIIGLLAENSYVESWKYVPFLLIGVVFSSFSGFLGTNYIAAKKTFGVFKSSVYGAIINIIILFSLVPNIGLNGASIATMFSYFVIWIIRIKDTKKYVDIKVDWHKLAKNFIVVFLQIGILYVDIKLNYLIQVVLVFILCFINRDEILKMLKMIRKIINRKKRIRHR